MGRAKSTCRTSPQVPRPVGTLSTFSKVVQRGPCMLRRYVSKSSRAEDRGQRAAQRRVLVLAAPQSVENLPCCIPLLSTLRCPRAELEPEPDFPRGHPGHICKVHTLYSTYMQELGTPCTESQSVLYSVSIHNIIAKASAPQSSFGKERKRKKKKKKDNLVLPTYVLCGRLRQPGCLIPTLCRFVWCPCR